MKLKYPICVIFICLLLPVTVEAQFLDMAVICPGQDEELSYLLSAPDGSDFYMTEAFRARNSDLNDWHSHLTVSADFTGDGLDEIARFEELFYKPNMVPDFTHSMVWVSRSRGDDLLPDGSWFSIPDSILSFRHVDFTTAGDYNRDGFDDIALFYNDRDSDHLAIYVLLSEGSGFSDPQAWYSCDRSDFNFSAVKFAGTGDFNGNGKPDIAVFYDYFGTAPDTRQSVFLFESQGNSFSLLPRVYDDTKESHDFDLMRFACAGDFNLDGNSDMAILHEGTIPEDLIITVFEGSAGNQLSPLEYNSYMNAEPSLTHVFHAVGGNFSGDTATDLALFYDNPSSGKQEVLVLESELNSFKAPNTAFSEEPGNLFMEDIHVVNCGKFTFKPLVHAATWKEDRKGALSFTFDDGYVGAFEHGGAELEAAGLKGTFYIFTDTLKTYDGELAGTSLIREYGDLGHELASHTSNHSNLGLLTEAGDTDSIRQVLSVSIETLNQRFDQYTKTMSIPFGSFQYETLELISEHFYTARSSQHGFNLATPYDFYALKSWPVISTTSPAFVDYLLSMAEDYGTYLPLMYHDMLDEPFNEDILIYTYSRELFRQTVQAAVSRELWIDTHERIYKYIRERNALRILDLDASEMEREGGSFSFVADDGLADSVYNVPLTLKIYLPRNWSGDTLSVGPEGNYSHQEVLQDGADRFIYYDWLPVSNTSIHVHDGILNATGSSDAYNSVSPVSLEAFPNPFRLETRISLSGEDMTGTHLILIDMHGAVVFETDEINGNSFVLFRSSLPPGIYIVRLLKAGTAINSLKLIAQ